MNSNGEVLKSFWSEAVFPEYDVEPQSALTPEGAIFTAVQPEKNRLHLLETSGTEVVWDTAIYCTEDSQRISLRLIEALPCKGVVVVYNEYPVDFSGLNQYAESGILTKLLYFDEYRRFQKSFSFKTLPTLSSTDTSFVAGYTYIFRIRAQNGEDINQRFTVWK